MKKMKVSFKNIKLTKSQKEAYDAIHDNSIKYLTLVWSRQSGKSTMMLVTCLELLVKKDKNIVYFTPTYKLAKTIFEKLSSLFPKQLVKKSNSSDLVLQTLTNSQITFISGEAAQTARGITATHIIIDEAAYIKNEVDGQSFWFNIVQPLIKVKGEKVILVSTPFGKSGFFYEFYLKGINNEEGYKTIVKTIYDDSLVSRETIDLWKKNYPRLAWQCEYECKFITNALSVFPNYEDCFKDDFHFKTSCKLFCGVDLSSVGNDDTIVTFINEFNQVIQYKIEGELDAKYQKIAKLIQTYKPFHAYIEQNGVGAPMLNEIQKLSGRKTNIEGFTTTNLSKREQIGKLSILIQNNDITFDKKNTLLYKELGVFSYKLLKNGNISYAAVSGEHDDAVLSLMLAIQSKMDAKTPQTSNNFFEFNPTSLNAKFM